MDHDMINAIANMRVGASKPDAVKLRFDTNRAAYDASKRIVAFWERCGADCDIRVEPTIDKSKKGARRSVWVLTVTARPRQDHLGTDAARRRDYITANYEDQLIGRY